MEFTASHGASCDEPICIKTDPFSTYKKYQNKGKAKALFEDLDDSTSDSSNQGSFDKSNLYRKDTGQKSENKEEKKVKSIEVDDYLACPNTRESLGFFTWNFLHTMAIYYPNNPSEEQKQKMRNFITGFAEFYPCKVCAHHFKNDIKKGKNFIF